MTGSDSFNLETRFFLSKCKRTQQLLRRTSFLHLRFIFPLFVSDDFGKRQIHGVFLTEERVG